MNTDTATELLRSIDESLKRLVGAGERRPASRSSPQPKRKPRGADPCRKCHMHDTCTLPCLEKDEYDGRV